MIITENISKGIFLLIVAICGNFVAETMSCSTQKLLNNNMYAKHLIVFTTIYFCISYTDDIDPFKNIRNAIYIYIGFLMFTKMDLNNTIICFMLLLYIYIGKNFKKYYKNKNLYIYKKLEEIENYVEIIFYICLTYGFLKYLNNQKEDHLNNFDLYKFLFGVLQCGEN